MTPVIVLTGFLGSGKTTLLTHWLKMPAFSRTAVIVNEFGDVGLDHHLVQASTDSMVRLSTGCLCCVVKDELLDTLNELDLMRRTGAAQFDRVIIETSGLSDPTGICHALLSQYQLGDQSTTGSAHLSGGQFELRHIIATVDSLNDTNDLHKHPEGIRQLALADRLVVTKTDLSRKSLIEIEHNIRSINPSSPLFDSADLCTDPTPCFSGPAYDDHLQLKDSGDHTTHPPTTAKQSHATPRHSVQSIAVRYANPISAAGLALFLEALAEHCGEHLLRIKGLVNVMESDDQPAVIHGMQHVLYPITWLESWPDDDRATRLVLIGQDISAAWVLALLAAIELEVAAVC